MQKEKLNAYTSSHLNELVNTIRTFLTGSKYEVDDVADSRDFQILQNIFNKYINRFVKDEDD